MGESIVDATKQAMKESFSHYEIKVALIFEPAWCPDMISEQENNF